MNHDFALGCSCGKVRGHLHEVSRQRVHRIICHCGDCQAFLRHLARVDLLDASGGCDLLQCSPADMTFEEGTQHIVGMRLSSRGLYRWYARCCHTPLGNTAARPVPIIGGVPASLLIPTPDTAPIDEVIGKPRGALHRPKTPEQDPRTDVADFRAVAKARYLLMILGLNRGGHRWTTWPHPFFDTVTRRHKYPVLETLS
jgi:Family of unknown function (DUF6151)